MRQGASPTSTRGNANLPRRVQHSAFPISPRLPRPRPASPAPPLFRCCSMILRAPRSLNASIIPKIRSLAHACPSISRRFAKVRPAGEFYVAACIATAAHVSKFRGRASHKKCPGPKRIASRGNRVNNAISRSR